MKKIRDERLILQNFKNIRTTLLIENSAILLILFWQGWQKKQSSESLYVRQSVVYCPDDCRFYHDHFVC
ncbi:hypothetical protein ACYSJS_13105 [Lactiplantibacillus plantarum]|uniref:hypothetical protein n=1 Tax=Lactiplantibacillus plantarum TaxID=1590 RepID=UPI003C26958E